MKNTLFLSALLSAALYIVSCDFVMVPKEPVPPVYTEQDSVVNFIEPLNNASYPQNTEFTIRWYLCNNAFKYELQFSSDSMFTSPSTHWINSPVNFFNVNSGACSSTCAYFYRIRAYFPPNNTSGSYWSDIKRYNTTH